MNKLALIISSLCISAFINEIKATALVNEFETQRGNNSVQEHQGTTEDPYYRCERECCYSYCDGGTATTPAPTTPTTESYCPSYYQCERCVQCYSICPTQEPCFCTAPTTPEPCPIPTTPEPCPTPPTPEPCTMPPTPEPCPTPPTPQPCPTPPTSPPCEPCFNNSDPKFTQTLYQTSVASWPAAGTSIHLGILAETDNGQAVQYNLVNPPQFITLGSNQDILFTSDVAEGAFVGPNNVMLIEVTANYWGDSSSKGSAIVAIVFPRGSVLSSENEDLIGV